MLKPNKPHGNLTRSFFLPAKNFLDSSYFSFFESLTSNI